MNTTVGTVEGSGEALPDVTLADIRAMQGPQEKDKGMSLWARMRLSYGNMREAVRTLIEEHPSEQRLLFFVLLSDIIFFLSRSLALVITPGEAAADAMPLEIGYWLIAALAGRTAILYAFSALVGWVCRKVGGTGSWRDTRTGVFWAALVAAPIGVVGALVVAVFAQLEVFFPILGTPMFALPPQAIGLVAFVYFLSSAVAEAQGFKRTSPVFMVFGGLTVVAALASIFVYVQVFMT